MKQSRDESERRTKSTRSETNVRISIKQNSPFVTESINTKIYQDAPNENDVYNIIIHHKRTHQNEIEQIDQEKPEFNFQSTKSEQNNTNLTSKYKTKHQKQDNSLTTSNSNSDARLKILPTDFQNLLDSLASNILETYDPDIIDDARTTSYFLINSQTINKKPQNFDYWAKKWKNSISPDYIHSLSQMKKVFGDQKLAIFDLLNSLSSSNLHIVSTIKPNTIRKTIVHIKEPIPDMILVQELKKLLLGDESKILLTNDDGKITCEKYTIPHQNSSLNYVSRIIKIVNQIRTSNESFTGSIGRNMLDVIEKEFKPIVEQIENIDTNKTSLLSLETQLTGTIFEKLQALAIICYAISSKFRPSLLNTISYCQKHGSPQILSFGSQLIDAGIESLLVYIRDWTVFGVLKDPENEFFVTKHSGKLSSQDWWSNKYTRVQEKIPVFLNENSIIRKILNAGRARNFVIKYKDSCMKYVDNFGSTAPFAINFTSQKSKEEINNEWVGPPFELSMVPLFYKDAVNSMRYMTLDIVWIPGHLRTLVDFILFGRGDFAKALFTNFDEAEDGDAAALFVHAMKDSTPMATTYINPITREPLHDRVDLKEKWTQQPTVDEVKLVYLTNAPIDIFLTQEVLRRYYSVSDFIWKLKVSEFRLGNDWHNSRKLELLELIGFEHSTYRLMNATRQFMLATVTSLVEYLCTDIIMCNFTKMTTKMKSSEDFDDMLKLHTDYLDYICENSFQTQKHFNILKIVNSIVEYVSIFHDLMAEIEGSYQAVIKYSQKKKRWTKKDHPFIQKQQESFADISNRLSKLYEDFVALLRKFYILIQDEKVQEMQFLEMRLRRICINIL
ncbi:Spc97 / Spc98 family protein [Trichomonas vaginalis G3]|uniref:Spc97 / Spc98 family protein n=1 Tax=Trichomonas vaginalis (strain ATCC PRA-98 / G3) TaxID=412133 RepID=A2E313_TRIV3|nr:microtubule nucleation by interphase microtubule organizing center [Trichomonas vaginalis G3]EAY12949.1 Spc97 / Spc98 family protein [Trichomonas vaginalis G3]KAI5499761.1 microtubule nucleation by interphase microtubule organizing center [Trichomonas vaginalis G3]|eukprot:XP_001325172.1 Spc97 / Spc98 family protein [Trichomonas vaginalis G3]